MIELVCSRCGIEFRMSAEVHYKRTQREQENANQCKDCFQRKPKIDPAIIWANYLADQQTLIENNSQLH